MTGYQRNIEEVRAWREKVQAKYEAMPENERAEKLKQSAEAYLKENGIELQRVPAPGIEVKKSA